MGGWGFRVDRLHERQNLQPNCHQEICCLNPEGVAILVAENAHNSWLPNISQHDIKAMSKADGLAKSLVCLQAIWFLAQCLTRRKYRLVQLKG